MHHSTADWQTSLAERPLRWLLLLACAHVLARVLIADGLKWDESEQILWSQQLLLGYGAQPPAYTWLQWAVVQLLGPGVLALTLLKHALIVLTYVLAWQAARVLLPAKGAFCVAGALALMLPFGWDGVRDQSHTILVTAMAFGLWWMALRQIKAPDWRNFVWLGLFCGLGMLAKYSFAMLIAAFAAAALTVPQARRALLARGWWLAPLAGLLVFAPHGAWLLHHWSEATSETINKMDIAAAASRAKGLGALASALLGTLGLWLIAVLASYGRRLRSAAAQPPAWRAWAWPLLARYLALVLLALLGMVLVGHVSSFRQRWVLPLVAVAPLALYAWRPALLESGGRRFINCIVGALVLFWLVATMRPWLGGWRGQPDELNHPVAQLARQLAAAGYDGRGVVVGSDHMIAAMAHTRFAKAHAVACNPGRDNMPACVAAARRLAAQQGGGLLLIARMDKAPADWWAQAGIATPPQTLSIPYVHMRAGVAPLQYQFLWQPRP